MCCGVSESTENPFTLLFLLKITVGEYLEKGKEIAEIFL